MDDNFYENLDENFKQACIMAEKDFSKDEILNLLKNGNITEKQIAVLSIKNIESLSEADILLNNLVGCDGKIREAVAFTINNFINSDKYYIKLFSELNPQIFAQASIDINANICKMAINSAGHLCNNNINFAQHYLACILQFIKEALAELNKFIYKDKKYTINKQLFKLYWSLDALKSVLNLTPEATLHKILIDCLNINEYTIREKVSEIVFLTNTFDDIKEQLLNDENYYVREALNHHRSFNNF